MPFAAHSFSERILATQDDDEAAVVLCTYYFQFEPAKLRETYEAGPMKVTLDHAQVLLAVQGLASQYMTGAYETNAQWTEEVHLCLKKAESVPALKKWILFPASEDDKEKLKNLSREDQAELLYQGNLDRFRRWDAEGAAVIKEVQEFKNKVTRVRSEDLLQQIGHLKEFFMSQMAVFFVFIAALQASLLQITLTGPTWTSFTLLRVAVTSSTIALLMQVISSISAVVLGGLATAISQRVSQGKQHFHREAIRNYFGMGLGCLIVSAVISTALTLVAVMCYLWNAAAPQPHVQNFVLAIFVALLLVCLVFLVFFFYHDSFGAIWTGHPVQQRLGFLGNNMESAESKAWVSDDLV